MRGRKLLQGQNFAELRANLLRLTAPAKGRYVEVLRPLLESWCQRNPSLQRRMANVAIFAMELGRAARMRPEELEALHNAALFHVIASAATEPEPASERREGKQPIESSLRSSASMSKRAERRAGAERARECGGGTRRRVARPGPGDGMPAPLRERYDGAGLPDGLAGKEIPLGARVLAVADACDALIADRVEGPGSMDGEIMEALQPARREGTRPGPGRPVCEGALRECRRLIAGKACRCCAITRSDAGRASSYLDRPAARCKASR